MKRAEPAVLSNHARGLASSAQSDAMMPVGELRGEPFLSRVRGRSGLPIFFHSTRLMRSCSALNSSGLPANLRAATRIDALAASLASSIWLTGIHGSTPSSVVARGRGRWRRSPRDVRGGE